MSNDKNDTTAGFNFNAWINQNALQSIESVFVKHSLNTVHTLHCGSTEFASFVSDAELRQSYPLMIGTAVSAIQKLTVMHTATPGHEKETTPIAIATIVITETEGNILKSIRNNLHEIETRHHEIESLQQMYARVRQRYLDEKQCKLDSARSKIHSFFDTAVSEITSRRDTILQQLVDLDQSGADGHSQASSVNDAVHQFEEIARETKQRLNHTHEACMELIHSTSSSDMSVDARKKEMIRINNGMLLAYIENMKRIKICKATVSECVQTQQRQLQQQQQFELDLVRQKQSSAAAVHAVVSAVSQMQLVTTNGDGGASANSATKSNLKSNSESSDSKTLLDSLKTTQSVADNPVNPRHLDRDTFDDTSSSESLDQLDSAGQDNMFEVVQKKPLKPAIGHEMLELKEAVARYEQRDEKKNRIILSLKQLIDRMQQTEQLPRRPPPKREPPPPPMDTQYSNSYTDNVSGYNSYDVASKEYIHKDGHALKRTYSYPLPDKAPFSVWLGNLLAEAKPSHIVSFLEPIGVEPKDVRFGRIHKNKYTCAYVDFYSKEDMRKALFLIDCTDAPQFMGRKLEIAINDGIVVDREAAVTWTSSNNSYDVASKEYIHKDDYGHGCDGGDKRHVLPALDPMTKKDYLARAEVDDLTFLHDYYEKFGVPKPLMEFCKRRSDFTGPFANQLWQTTITIGDVVISTEESTKLGSRLRCALKLINEYL